MAKAKASAASGKVRKSTKGGARAKDLMEDARGLHKTSVERALRSGLEGQARVSEKATVYATNKAASLLKSIAASCRTYLVIAKKKTVTKECIVMCLEQAGMKKAEEKASVAVKSPKGKRSTISQGSILNVFRGYLGKDIRLSESGKHALADAINYYVKELAKSGQKVTRIRGAVTLDSKDMSALGDIC